MSKAYAMRYSCGVKKFLATCLLHERCPFVAFYRVFWTSGCVFFLTDLCLNGVVSYVFFDLILPWCNADLSRLHTTNCKLKTPYWSQSAQDTQYILYPKPCVNYFFRIISLSCSNIIWLLTLHFSLALIEYYHSFSIREITLVLY